MTKNVVLRVEQRSEQECGPVRKIVGLLSPSAFVKLVDSIDLSANPRSAKKGAVTEDIETSLRETIELFPAKTKGILVAASQYRALERNRYELGFVDDETEGLLDGGHNTFSIGRHILREAGLAESKIAKVRNWDSFKAAWNEHRDEIEDVIDLLEFQVPVEIQVPLIMSDPTSVDDFKSSLLEIGAARNNNVQLTEETKANKQGLYEDLKDALPSRIAERVEWKSNDGGDIKPRDILALCWIPLSLLDLPDGISVNANQIYRNKGVCVEQFNRLLKHPSVSTTVEGGYDYELQSESVRSAIRIGASFAALHDEIYALFPHAYNRSGGNYGRISAVKIYDPEKIGDGNSKYLKRPARTPFFRKDVNYTCPDGFSTPLLYALRVLINVDNEGVVTWGRDPHEFLKNRLTDILKSYRLAIELGNWDPQQVGKKMSAYDFAESAVRNLL